MNNYNLYVTIIFLFKVAFIFMAVYHLYLKAKNKENSDLDKKIVYWKEHFEFIFIALMSILLVYLFNPYKDRLYLINRETKVLLFLFGIVLIITAKWDIFIKESNVFQKIQSIVGQQR